MLFGGGCAGDGADDGAGAMASGRIVVARGDSDGLPRVGEIIKRDGTRGAENMPGTSTAAVGAARRAIGDNNGDSNGGEGRKSRRLR